MPDYYITAIRMGEGNEEQHIEFLQCLNPSTGNTRTWYPKRVAKMIDEGKTFQVGSSDGPVDVVAVHRKNDDDYVRTEADGEPTNNLLELPEF